MSPARQRLLLLIGTPAVGKMTVGRAIAHRSDFRLFHNSSEARRSSWVETHATIEPLLADRILTWLN